MGCQVKNNIKKPFYEGYGDSVVSLLKHFIEFVINEFIILMKVK